MDKAKDFYIVAVYTAHSSVNNQNYIIPIVNSNYTLKEGIRIILRPSSYLYKQITDQLEAQGIYLTYNQINEYILKYPIKIGSLLLCSFDGIINKSTQLIEEVLSFEFIKDHIKKQLTQRNVDDSFLSNESFIGFQLDLIVKTLLKHIKSQVGYKDSNFSPLLEDNIFAIQTNFFDDTNEQLFNDLWNPMCEKYSLELYSLFCKGNYLYSSLKYQKEAIESLINMIRNDYDNIRSLN